MSSLRGKRVFYVEDDLKNLTLTQAILEVAGATFTSERWLKNTTLAKLRAAQPLDIILLDLMYPNGVTGYQIFELIRADAAFNHVPIVAVSASDPAVEIPRLRQVGFNGFIAKPITLHTFPKQVAAAIAGEAVWCAGDFVTSWL